MGTRAKTIPAALACLAASATALCVPAGAPASTEQEAILQDDPKIVFWQSRAQLDRTLREVKALGVDRIRVSVFWDLFGPAPRSRRRPAFAYGESDPRSYRADAWHRYDEIVKSATEHGLGVLLNVTAPAPHWAADPRSRGFNKNRVVNPDVAAFRDWVEALGDRYSGSYVDPQRGSARLPEVRHWSIWNEPNFPSWLYPQWRRAGRSLVPRSPALYRALVEAAYEALARTGHGDDTILLGETASGGARSVSRGVPPMIFLREMYCLNRRYAPYTGRAARRRGCPATAAARAAFVSTHPGLFTADGWGHHPYNRAYRPSRRDPAPDSVAVGDLPRLTRGLQRVFSRWGSSAAPAVWITEHGYQTDPPDPTARVSPFRAGVWLAEADFIAYRNPRVASTAQFLLFDDAPRRRYPRSMPRIYWGTWQSGLYTERGDPKPALDFFRHPIAIGARRGSSVRLWAQYRPAPDGSTLGARVEFSPLGDDDWQVLASAEVTNPRGFLDVRVQVPDDGRVRVVWNDAAGLRRSSPSLRVRAGR